jgi:hypothetical protein
MPNYDVCENVTHVIEWDGWGAVNVAVTVDVRENIDETVDRDVYGAVWQAIREALDEAVWGDPKHPMLSNFLLEAGGPS